MTLPTDAETARLFMIRRGNKNPITENERFLIDYIDKVVDELRAASSDSLPQAWIQKYIDSLLEFANNLDRSDAARLAAISRADGAMDLVKAWRERERK